MKIIRKKAAALGLTPAMGAPATAKPSTRSPAAAGTKDQKRKANTMLNDGSE